MYLQTAKLPWYPMRLAVVASDTPLSEFYYANWPTSNTVDLYSGQREGISTLILSAYGKDAENKDAGYKLYGRRYARGMIELLATGVWTLGTQTVVKDPISAATITAYWADTVTVTGGILFGHEYLMDVANNRIGQVRFDVLGMDDLFCEIDLAGGASPATELNVIYTGV